jgi:hypothetical protein
MPYRMICRYVGYFWQVLSAGPKPLGSLPKPRTLQLRQISISGLPQGSAEQCSVVVEVRPSGSCAASGSRVFVSRAVRPSAPGVPGEWVGEEHLLNVCMFESQLCIFCD